MIDFTIRHAPIHSVVKIGTPQGSDVTATKRRSIVPSVGESPNSSFPSLDDLNSHLPTHLDPSAYLSAHPNGQQQRGDTSPEERRPSVASSGLISRDSTTVSFIDDFPSPPNFSEPALESNTHNMPTKHASAFGQLVTGPPGAGKTTYCHGMHQVSL